MALPPHVEHVCRKRTRNGSEDEASEFTPLSKRINNLHLNTFSESLLEHKPGVEPAHTDLLPTDEHCLKSLQYDCATGQDNPTLSSPQCQEWPVYSPDLSFSENPFYYEPNRLLFDLYQQRLHRQPTQQQY